MNALKTLVGKKLAAAGINWFSTTWHWFHHNLVRNQKTGEKSITLLFSFYILQAQVLHYNLCPALTWSDSV